MQIKNHKRKRVINTLSLFTGAGGLDIGFDLAGFQIDACVEVEPWFCETLEANNRNYFRRSCNIVNIDISQVWPEEINLRKCDFIIGGPPCQSFSAAGRRAGGVQGIKDERGSLFEHYLRLIEHYQPKGFLFENVRGILSANKRKDWQYILREFENLGYSVVHRVLDAADYGVPQYRERLILVGHREKSPFLFPRPTHGPDSISGRPHLSCLEAIKDLQDPNESSGDYGGKYGDLLNEVPPGMNYLYFTKEMGYPNPVFAWRSRFSDFLYKANPDRPVKTIVANLGRYSGPFHWKNRKFTLSEFMRLQSFPDNYEFAGSLNNALRQIGNSVAPRFAEQLAKAVALQLFHKKDVDIDLMPADFMLSFDSRKKEKAKQTREKRRKEAQIRLFKNGLNRKTSNGNLVKHKTNYWCFYKTWKDRAVEKQLLEYPGQVSFRVNENIVQGAARILVERKQNGKLLKRSLARIVLDFDEIVGTGLKSILCEVRSITETDVVAGWDAIESCLCHNSNYYSLMDVFGHFTEPHPIFTLRFDILKTRPAFLLKFLKHFSDFARIAKNYPMSIMDSIENRKGFHFNDKVKWLRSLRFDVRVHETNRSIPSGYFRVCYPFPLHVDKQVSVKWMDV